MYARSLLAFSAVSVLGLYALLRLQPKLPLSLGFPGVPADQAFNTAASFVTNTNWQSYSGESAMGHLAQMAGLAVQNFVVRGGRDGRGGGPDPRLRRGRAPTGSATSGSTWSAACLRMLLPLPSSARWCWCARRGAEPDRRHGGHHAGGRSADHHRRAGGLPGGHQGARHQRRRVLQRELRAPVREPERRSRTCWRSSCCWSSPCRCPARSADGQASGRATRSWPRWRCSGRLSLTAIIGPGDCAPRYRPAAAGASMEGKEVRFGVAASALFAVSTTGTSTGAVDSFHDSYTALGGGLAAVEHGARARSRPAVSASGCTGCWSWRS